MISQTIDTAGGSHGTGWAPHNPGISITPYDNPPIKATHVPGAEGMVTSGGHHPENSPAWL